MNTHTKQNKSRATRASEQEHEPHKQRNKRTTAPNKQGTRDADRETAREARTTDIPQRGTNSQEPNANAEHHRCPFHLEVKGSLTQNGNGCHLTQGIPARGSILHIARAEQGNAHY